MFSKNWTIFFLVIPSQTKDWMVHKEYAKGKSTKEKEQTKQKRMEKAACGWLNACAQHVKHSVQHYALHFFCCILHYIGFLILLLVFGTQAHANTYCLLPTDSFQHKHCSLSSWIEKLLKLFKGMKTKKYGECEQTMQKTIESVAVWIGAKQANILPLFS